MTRTRRSAGFLATAKALCALSKLHEFTEDILRTAANRTCLAAIDTPCSGGAKRGHTR